MFLFAGCQNSTALNSLHCSIRSKVEVNFVDVCHFDTRRDSPELEQVRLLVRSLLRVVLNKNQYFENPLKFTNFPLPWVHIEVVCLF